MKILDADHDLYYRILLSISIGDRIRWKIRPERPDLHWYYGTVTSMHATHRKDSAYMMVEVESYPDDNKVTRGSRGMAVHFDNYTIEKMVEPNPYDTQSGD